MGNEKTWFEWKDCFDISAGVFAFYECKLKKDMGKFKAGKKFGTIIVDASKGVIEFYQGVVILETDKADGKLVGILEIDYANVK